MKTTAEIFAEVAWSRAQRDRELAALGPCPARWRVFSRARWKMLARAIRTAHDRRAEALVRPHAQDVGRG